MTKLRHITISSIHVLATPENDKVLTKHLCAQLNFFFDKIKMILVRKKVRRGAEPGLK